MTRSPLTMWPAFVAVTVVLVISHITLAQPDEGRRWRGGPGGGRLGGASSVRLASLNEVQDALKLSDDQKTKVEEINDQFRSNFRKLLQEGGRREEMQKLNQNASAKLAELLDDEQEKRLRGITIQVMGANAVVADPALAKELNVTDEQKSKLKETQQSIMRAMGDAFRKMRDSDASGKDRRAKFEELRAEAEKKLLAVLTTEQQNQLNALKGKKVEISMSQLRGSGGRGRFDGRGGGRGERSRDDRDRDASGDQNK
ncbi:MAG: hypothetical protein L0228_15565 [Planctomycetes bacterium]|nr:hypothetical protein [Planctomycetota bacterium]